MKYSSISIHICAFAIFTVLIVSLYVTVQQVYRSSANDPQVQLARDAAAQLEKGHMPAITDSIDIANSLAPFIVVYNAAGRPVQSSGYLEGRLPQLPKGVLDYTHMHGEDWITWQPRTGVRMAMVVKKTASAATPFVAAGRSLLEVENREASLTKTLFIAWVAGIVILGINWVILFKPATA